MRCPARALACLCLAAAGCGKDVEAWRADLDDEEAFVRRMAAVALGTQEGGDACESVRSLVAVFVRDPNPEVRAAAADSLARIGGDCLAPVLSTLGNEQVPEGPAGGLALLVLGAGPRAVDELEKALREHRGRRRFVYAHLLGEIGGPGAQALVRALDGLDPEGRVLAAQGLARCILRVPEVAPPLEAVRADALEAGHEELARAAEATLAMLGGRAGGGPASTGAGADAGAPPAPAPPPASHDG